MSNNLNKPWREKFGLPSFNRICSNDFLPALREAIDIAEDNIEQIAQNTAFPTFSNTVEPLEVSDIKLSRLAALFFNLISVNVRNKSY